MFISIFFLSTMFFLFQHAIHKQAWDFYVYTMNGKFWFYDGHYFELYRAPLAPLMLGILGSNFIAEYLYIVLVSAIFACSSYLLARKLNFDEVVFYALSMNVFVLLEGLLNGTELLSLALFELAIVAILADRCSSGFFMGLSFLARYNMLAFLPALLFHRNWKKVILSFVLFFLAVFPWLLYNKLFFGNFFASIADSYALNVFFRRTASESPSFFDFLAVANFLLPFFILGILKFRKDRKDLLMVLILILAIVGYLNTPHKTARYLFTATLPLVYFSTKGIKWKREYAFLLFCFSICCFSVTKPYPPVYEEMGQKLEELNLTHCKIRSNLWPYLNYMGYKVYPPVKPDLAQQEVEKGVILAYYRYAEGYANVTPLIYDGGYYQIFGYPQNCTKAGDKIVFIYLEQVNYTLKVRGYDYGYGYCDVLPMPKLCKVINRI